MYLLDTEVTATIHNTSEKSDYFFVIMIVIIREMVSHARIYMDIIAISFRWHMYGHVYYC